MLDGLEYDFSCCFPAFLGWLLLLFHTVIVAPGSLAGGDERRPIGVSLAWLALIYAIPFAGVGFCVLFGEIRLGAAGRERAQAMYRPYAIWIRQLARLFPSTAARWEQGPSAPRPYPGRLAMPMLSGNRMTLLQQTDWIIREIVRDIRAPPNPAAWSSTSGIPAGTWTRCARR